MYYTTTSLNIAMSNGYRGGVQCRPSLIAKAIRRELKARPYPKLAYFYYGENEKEDRRAKQLLAKLFGCKTAEDECSFNNKDG